MRATNEISRALAGETDLGVVLELIAKRGRALVGASALLIELVVGDRLTVAAVAGDVDRAIVGSEIDTAGTVAGRVLDTRRPQRLSDELNRARFNETGLGHLGLQAGAGLFVPLVFRTETPGVLVALHPPGWSRLQRRGRAAADVVRDERGERGGHRALGRHASSCWRARPRPRTSAAAGRGSCTTRRCRASAPCACRWPPPGVPRIPDAWRAALDDGVAQLDTEIANVRGIISDVRPAALDELGIGGGGGGAGRSVPQPRDRRGAARRPRLRGRQGARRATTTSWRRRSTGSRRRR